MLPITLVMRGIASVLVYRWYEIRLILHAYFDQLSLAWDLLFTGSE
jgi:hypothetical protein